MDPNEIAALIREIRLCFNQLKEAAERLHEGTGISTPMRAVMEAITKDGPATVPQIARSRSVTRQHIQVQTDRLLEAGLVETRRNPAHQASPLMGLTPGGQALFRAMTGREADLLPQLATGLSDADVAGAATVLRALTRNLARHLDGVAADTGDDHDSD